MNLGRQIRFWSIGLIVFVVALYLLRGILLPFVAGMAVAYLLDPVCDRLERWGLSRTLATAVLTAVFLLISVAAVLVIVPAVAGQVVALVERAPAFVQSLRAALAALLVSAEARVEPVVFDQLQTALAGSAERLASWMVGLAGGLLSGGVALVNLVSLLVIMPVVAFYLLRDWDRIIAWVDGCLPRGSAETIRGLAREVDRRLAGFLRGQGTVCLILGIFYAIGLSLAGLEFGLVVGMIAGILSFIPYVGAIVGLVLSVGLALLQFDEWSRVAIVAAIFIAGQAVEGNLLTPKLVGGRVGLHPVWVLFALLAGGALFGFVGVMLAVPAAAVVGVGVRFGLEQYRASPLYGAGAPPADEKEDR
ncbi:MAG: AI-2E family transporter [Kiloniellaceae bacterium]